MSDLKPTKARARRVQAKGRKRLGKLLEMHGHKCYWCRRPIIDHTLIDECLIIKKSGNCVYWFWGEQVAQLHYATIDHLKEVSVGGTNDWGNIVPSCQGCNTMRSNKPRMFVKRFGDHPHFQAKTSS